MKEPENWLRDFILERLANEGSVVALFIGRTGSSKSGSAISLAYAMDPTFNLDRIVFRIEDFYRISTEQNLKPGSFIVFDDAGVDAGARKWQDEKNQAFGAILQTFRYKQLPTLITTPRIQFLDKQVRDSVELQFVATDRKGYFKPFVLYESPKMDGKIWHSYPSVGGVEIRLWPFPPPPEDFFNEYKKKKDQAFQRMIQENMMKIKQEEELARVERETKEQMLRLKLKMMQERAEMMEERKEAQLRRQAAMAERELARQEAMRRKEEARLAILRQKEQEKAKRDAIKEARRKKWTALWKQGKSFQQIAKMEGTSAEYVRRLIRSSDEYEPQQTTEIEMEIPKMHS